jgi:signal transduction histidine kinase
MKLLNKTNEYYIAVAIAILFIGSFVIANRILYLVNKELNDRLANEKSALEMQIANQPGLASTGIIIGDRIEIVPIEQFTTTAVQLKDTGRYDPYSEKMVPYRQLAYEKLINNRVYKIKILKRLPEMLDLFQGLAITIVLTAIDVIFCFYFLNRWFSRKVWGPFYGALNKLKAFDLNNRSQLVFKKSDIDEFNDLNEELAKLTDRIVQDYHNLKEFTENASHEIQTPLAIIRSRLELMLQSDLLNNEHVQNIQVAMDAVHRLSKLNKELILLTRIENHQFEESETFLLNDLIIQQLDHLEVFITPKNITVEKRMYVSANVKMNRNLADILISNLFTNAIKYNDEGGRIVVELNQHYLIISNTGEQLKVDPEKIFERFLKDKQSESLGLGLAIVKKICDFYGFTIEYSYLTRDKMHSFIIQLNAI